MTAGARHVRVAVDAVADRPERTYTYLAPGDEPVPAPGSLLLVPYGRLALGYALDGSPEPAGADLRLGEAVVSAPMLTPDLLALSEEIAAYYRAPIGTTLAAMLPPGLESRIERRWDLLQPDDLPAGLSDIADADGRVSDAALQRRGPRRGRNAWVERLRRAGAIRPRWSLREAEGQPQARPRAPAGCRRGRAITARAAPARPARRARDRGGRCELAASLETEPAALLPAARRLAALGGAELDWRIVERSPLAHRSIATPLRHELADEQVAALDAIAALPGGGELLLEGVAASGKTDVYLAAMQEALDAASRASCSSPRRASSRSWPTACAPSPARRSRSCTRDSRRERHDEWWRILRGEARVVVGTRTAAFAPVADLGLVIVDEAHDGGYKSDRTPRYDGRWVARRRAALGGARVVLGTATPTS